MGIKNSEYVFCTPDGIPVITPPLTIEGVAVSADSKDIISQIDVSKYKTILLQTTGTFTATLQAQFSNDGTTWYVGHMAAQAAGNANVVTAVTYLGMFSIPVQGKYFRLRCTAYTSGSPDAVAVCLQQQILPYNIMPYVNASIYSVTGLTATTNISQAKLISAAGTNATVIKAGAGRLYELSASNTGTTSVYVKLYDATSIKVGTTVPAVATYAVPAGASLTLLPMNLLGKYFSAGICLAITGGYTDADTTAVTAGAAIVNYSYR